MRNHNLVSETGQINVISQKNGNSIAKLRKMAGIMTTDNNYNMTFRSRRTKQPTLSMLPGSKIKNH